MSYTDKELQDLTNDLFGLGVSKVKVLSEGTHYGFGPDFKGENDGKTPLYINKEGADLMQEAGFGKWIKDLTFAIIWSNWKNHPKVGASWTNFPLPAADLVDPGILRVGLFQSSPRMHFPGDLPPERVKSAYEVLLGEIKKIKVKSE